MAKSKCRWECPRSFSDWSNWLAVGLHARNRWRLPVLNLDVLYQFNITLLESDPPIWRRIQVQDCTLDKLHEHIQTAMGWTNSHLHQFTIKASDTAIQNCWATASRISSALIQQSRCSVTFCPRPASDWLSGTSMISVTAGNTNSSTRGVNPWRKGGSIRSAWKANGPARQKMLVECGAMRSTWRPWPTQSTNVTTSSWTGVGHLTRTTSIRRRRPET
jgi:hypothetical protein